MESYDIIIRNGKVVDGIGAPGLKLTSVLKKRKSLKFSLAERAPLEIDATGFMVAPGFWDLHAHDDFVLPVKDHPERID